MNALNVVSYNNPFTRSAHAPKNPGKPQFSGIPQAKPLQALQMDEVYFSGPGRIGQIDEFYTIDDFIILPF